MPYMQMIEILRQQVAMERDPKRKEVLEAVIVLLIGMVEMRNKLDRMINQTVKEIQ